MRSLRMVCLALALGACTDWLAPESRLPEGAVPMAARPEFAPLWDEVTACLGDSAIHRDRAGLRFYVVPMQDTFTSRDGRTLAGLYLEPVPRIVFADLWSAGTLGASQPSYYRDPTIRHEFIHAQLGRSDHPSWVLARCGEWIHRETWHD